MSRSNSVSFLFFALIISGGLVGAANPAGKHDSEEREIKALAARIDELIDAELVRAGVPAAPVTTDEEFIRRLSLDLNGRIPTVSDLRDFLDDTRADKRDRWIDEFIGGTNHARLYASHFTNVWRREILGTAEVQPAVVGAFEGWLERQVEANTPYDRLAAGLLTDRAAEGFYVAADRKPEVLAARAARLFLGIRLDCAQCHDDRGGGSWKRIQFWEFAAIFAAPASSDAAGKLAPRIRVGDADDWAEARFPDGVRPIKGSQSATADLAHWLAKPENPWFARAAVNRMWFHFLGNGLVEPLDGFGSRDNPPSHPELLDELTRQFVAHGFDLKFLVRAIARSKTYQRSSRQTHSGQTNPRRFARAQVRAMTAEQLFASLALATGAPLGANTDAATELFQSDTTRAKFLATFTDAGGRPAEAQATVHQALLMMNGDLLAEALAAQPGRTLTAALGGPPRTTDRRIEELFLAALSRRPGSSERERFVRFVEGGERNASLRDLFWMILNSTEFVHNH